MNIWHDISPKRIKPDRFYAVIEISKGTKEYADSVLAGIEVALQDAMKVIQNNRKELK